jgi:hypothetical protein
LFRRCLGRLVPYGRLHEAGVASERRNR